MGWCSMRAANLGAGYVSLFEKDLLRRNCLLHSFDSRPDDVRLPAICSSISDNTSPYPQDEKKTVRRAHCLLCTVDLVVDQLVFFVIPAVKFTDLLANLL